MSSRHSLPRGCARRQQRATVPHLSCSGIVFSAYLWSVVSSRCFSSFCLKLEGTWKVVLAAELGAEKLVERERPAGATCCAPRASIEQCDRGDRRLPAPLCARRRSLAAPGTGQASGAQRVRELALGHTAHRFSKPRCEPRQLGFQTSALNAYTLLPW